MSGRWPNARQHADVRALIASGLAGGTRLVVGGPEAPEGHDTGFFVRPTILADVSNDMAVARQEIFGPANVMIPFDGEEKAISIGNDNDFGLPAYVLCSRPTRRAANA